MDTLSGAYAHLATRNGIVWLDIKLVHQTPEPKRADSLSEIGCLERDFALSECFNHTRIC